MPIVVCGDFNNHMTAVAQELVHLNFAAAFEEGTETHRLGGHLDQVFTRNVDVTNAVTNESYSDQVSDHRCLKVTLRCKQQLNAASN